MNIDAIKRTSDAAADAMYAQAAPDPVAQLVQMLRQAAEHGWQVNAADLIPLCDAIDARRPK